MGEQPEWVGRGYRRVQEKKKILFVPSIMSLGSLYKQDERNSWIRDHFEGKSSVDLWFESLSVADITVIAELLVDTETLERLFLSGNQTGDDGVIALSKGLKINDTLQGLFLGGNRIGDEGARALSEVLK